MLPVFAFGYAAVIRHILYATSRRSTKRILDSNLGTVLAFIHGQARGLLRRRIKWLRKKSDCSHSEKEWKKIWVDNVFIAYLNEINEKLLVLTGFANTYPGTHREKRNGKISLILMMTSLKLPIFGDFCISETISRHICGKRTGARTCGKADPHI